MLVSQYPLRDHDPRRSAPLVNWLLSLRLDFQSDSAFACEWCTSVTKACCLSHTRFSVNKSLGLLSCLVDSTYLHFSNQSDKYIDLFFDNIGTGFAEVCQTLVNHADKIDMHSPDAVTSCAKSVTPRHGPMESGVS